MEEQPAPIIRMLPTDYIDQMRSDAFMRKMGNTMVPGLHPTRRETKQWMDDHKRYWDTITAAIDRDYNERGIRQWRYWGLPTPDGW